MSVAVRDIFNILHNALEAKNNGRKISQKDMSKNLGVPFRTYQDWKLGNSNPIAVKIIVKMLSELEDDDIVRVVRKLNKM